MLLTLNSPKQNSPEELRGELKLHQRISLAACVKLESKSDTGMTTKVGIIADEVGAGKTLLALSLCLMNNPAEKNIPKYTTEFFYLTEIPDDNQYVNCNLFIIPHGLISMWKKVLDDFLPTVKYQYIRYTKDLKNFVLLPETKIVLLSSTRLRDFIQHNPCASKIWRRVFYEEADSLNIPANKEVKASFYWLITATPKRLFPYHRSTGFLRRIISNLYGLTFNGLLSHIIVKNSKEVIAKSIKLPPVKNRIIRCLIPQQLRQVRRYVSRQVLEALNAGDTETAITLLNCKVESKDNLTKAIRQDLEFKLNRTEAKLRYQQDIGSSDEIIQITIKKVESIKEQLNSIIQRIESQSNCPICLDELNKNATATLTCCNYWFCLHCISQALTSNPMCPMCRKSCTPQDIIANISHKSKNKNSKKSLPLKKDALIQLLSKNKQILVFSNYNNSFIDIEKELRIRKINYGHVKGHSGTIDKLLLNYKKGIVKVLLLNSNYQGAGHNLQNTDRIILLHQIKKDLKAQVIGRAQRLGRKTPLEVIELLYPNEEKN